MRRVCVRGIIYKDGKLFAQKLKNGTGENDYWCTPGGGLDEAESLHEGLTREMIEETGVTPEIGNLLYIQQYRDDEKEYLEFFFEITNTDDYETIDLAQTTHGHIEVSQYGFVDSKQEHILPAFLGQAEIGEDISENRPVKLFNYL